MDQAIISRIRQLQPDLKVEFILSELFEEGVKSSEVIINPQGAFTRRYTRDLISVEETEIMGSIGKFYHLKISRNSIYDALPEGLFHQPKLRKVNKTVKEVAEEIKYQRETEKNVRQFFLPIEQELYSLRTFIESEERKAIINNTTASESRVFIEFWDLPQNLEDQQLCNLLYLLPFCHLIVGNFELSKLCFESILNTEVEMRLAKPLKHSVTQQKKVKLNSVNLGSDFILGETYTETIPALEVQIKIKEIAELSDYLNEGKKQELLHFLFNYFLPIDHDVVTSIEIEENEMTFITSELDHEGRLGYTTYLVK
jgi:hypothetical protein